MKQGGGKYKRAVEEWGAFDDTLCRLFVRSFASVMICCAEPVEEAAVVAVLVLLLVNMRMPIRCCVCTFQNAIK